MKQLLIVALALFGMTVGLQAQSIVGKWKTVDDNSGKERSVVEIFQEDDKYFGKIIKFIPGPDEDPDPICDECKGKKKDQKIVGLQIIEDMEKEGDQYEGGEILDPENGKVYDCKLWIEDGKLKVRGYIMFLYRTQTWLPYDG
ncbi:MAG: DUF2147 domain-containing protein [Cytophagales bacterium]|nr:DUF2147 domain-containing protein [Cytophagales bacterium]